MGATELLHWVLLGFVLGLLLGLLLRQWQKPFEGLGGVIEASNSSNSVVYDVFLSHRGPDVKKHFCTFLHEALERAGVHVFLDEKDLKPGDEAWPTMKDALQNARIKIPVLSKGYTESQWCLDELVIMMSQPKESRQKNVMPVYYGWGADLHGFEDLRVRSMNMLRNWKKWDEWKDALKKVKATTGWRSDQTNEDMSLLVKSIVRGVLTRLGRPALEVAAFQVDIERHVTEIKEALSIDGVTMIALHGMGGIGKTTLAKAVYNDLYADFADASCFLEVGRDAKGDKLLKLQKQMLKDLCRFDVELTSISGGLSQINSRLGEKPVLLCVDDFWEQYQVDNILGLGGSPIAFAHGSKVVLTGRDSALFQRPGIYTRAMDILSKKAALELLSWHAFQRKDPPEKYAKSAKTAAEACGGLPLSLAVTGSYLWNKKSLEDWKDAVAILQSARPFNGRALVEDRQLWAILKTSYDDIAPQGQQMFLDIVCCMLGKEKVMCLPAWDNGQFQLETLMSRSLVYIKWGMLAVHDQLRDLGREIVRQENKRPEHRSRVWGVDAMEVIVTKGPWRLETVSLKGTRPYPVESFPELEDLRLLDLDGSPITNNIKCSSQLRYFRSSGVVDNLPTHCMRLRVLDLSGCLALESLPESIGAMTGLAILDLSRCWSLRSLPESVGALTGLMSLDLGWCQALTSLPESVGALTGLASLKLRECQALQSLPETVEALTGVTRLDLRECRALQNLPESIVGLTGLMDLELALGMRVSSRAAQLDLRWYKHLQSLPKSIGALTKLTSLDLWECRALQSLPESIGALTGLVTLDLRGCSALQSLPESVGALTGLARLNLRGCRALQSLPKSIGALTGVTSLDLRECQDLQSLPQSIGELTGLTSLELPLGKPESNAGLLSLPESIGALTGLTRLNLRWYKHLRSLPKSIGALTGLTSLDLGGCSALQSLPKSIGALKWVTSLDLRHSRALQSLPESLRELTGLTSLELPLGMPESSGALLSLPESIGALTRLTKLDLRWYKHLHSLPKSFGALTGLTTLDLWECWALQSLPESIGALTGLVRLDLRGCSALQSLPESIGSLTRLASLDLRECWALERLPESIEALTGLVSLNLKECRALQRLPESIGELTGLTSLHLRDCWALQSLPESMEAMRGLTSLDLRGCWALQSLPNWIGVLESID